MLNDELPRRQRVSRGGLGAEIRMAMTDSQFITRIQMTENPPVIAAAPS